MKTKTDDYLVGMLKRFDNLVPAYTKRQIMLLSNADQILAEQANSKIKLVKDFISKEFKEYAKNLAEVSSV